MLFNYGVHGDMKTTGIDCGIDLGVIFDCEIATKDKIIPSSYRLPFGDEITCMSRTTDQLLNLIV